MTSRIDTMPPTIDLAIRVLHAKLCMPDGRLDKARSVPDEIARHWPDAPELARTVANLCIAEGHPPAAARLLTAEHRCVLTTVTATVLLTQSLRQAGDLAGATSRMTEPLTERETLVLQYLRSMLSIAEIATVLSVSANTVKTHVRHVYRKLGVSRRRDAVRRARELSLI